MAAEKKRYCGNCGHCRDNREDALVLCRKLNQYVVRYSEPCRHWTDETYF